MNDILKEVKGFEEILSRELSKECRAVNDAGTLNSTDVKAIMDAVCLMLKIKEFREWTEGEMGYSRRMPHSTHGSYRRGRDMNTGRYISRSDGYPGWDDGYSQHSIKDRMIARLEGMMDEAGSDYERRTIENWISRLEMEK